MVDMKGRRPWDGARSPRLMRKLYSTEPSAREVAKMPTLVEKAAVIAKSLGMPSTVLERDGIAGARFLGVSRQGPRARAPFLRT